MMKAEAITPKIRAMSPRCLKNGIMPKAAIRVLIGLILLNCVLRLSGLDHAPPGFFSDEARAAANAICISQTGHDLVGQWMPAYSPIGRSMYASHAGGCYTAPWTFVGAIWARLFGDSIVAFRAIAVFYSLCSILFIYLLVGLLTQRTIGVIAAFVLAYMPAHFHLSRIAWDSSVLPFYLLAGSYCFLRGGVVKGKLWQTFLMVTAGFCFAVAGIAYSAPRVQLLGLIPALFWFRQRPSGLGRLARHEYVAFIASFLVFLWPVIDGVVKGFLLRRYDNVTIVDPAWLASFVPGNVLEHSPVSGLLLWKAVLIAFLTKLQLHFSHVFLFFSGDANLRHSSQFVGELGFMEAVAIGFAVWWLFAGKREPVALGTAATRWRAIKILCGIAVIFGVLPSAMTKESPHALRSIGAFPFVAIWVSLELWELVQLSGRWRSALLCCLGAGTLVFSTYFLHSYFVRYPRISGPSFQEGTLWKAREAQKTGDWERFIKSDDLERMRMARSYYAMVLGGVRCEEVRPWVFYKPDAEPAGGRDAVTRPK